MKSERARRIMEAPLDELLVDSTGKAFSYSNQRGTEWDTRPISLFGAARAFIKQLRIGMDLTHVSIPSIYLTPYSILEFMAVRATTQFETLLNVSREKDPQKRMEGVICWLLGSGKQEDLRMGHKPFNPILGEIHKARVDHSDGSHSYVICEQVKHHPPTSAFTVYNEQHGVSLSGNVLFGVNFTGNSVVVQISGGMKIRFRNHCDKSMSVSSSSASSFSSSSPSSASSSAPSSSSSSPAASSMPSPSPAVFRSESSESGSSVAPRTENVDIHPPAAKEESLPAGEMVDDSDWEVYLIPSGVPDILIRHVIFGTRYVIWSGPLDLYCPNTLYCAQLFFGYNNRKQTNSISGVIWKEQKYEDIPFLQNKSSPNNGNNSSTSSNNNQDQGSSSSSSSSSSSWGGWASKAVGWVWGGPNSAVSASSVSSPAGLTPDNGGSKDSKPVTSKSQPGRKSKPLFKSLFSSSKQQQQQQTDSSSSTSEVVMPEGMDYSDLSGSEEEGGSGQGGFDQYDNEAPLIQPDVRKVVGGVYGDCGLRTWVYPGDCRTARQRNAMKKQRRLLLDAEKDHHSSECTVYPSPERLEENSSLKVWRRTGEAIVWNELDLADELKGEIEDKQRLLRKQKEALVATSPVDVNESGSSQGDEDSKRVHFHLESKHGWEFWEINDRTWFLHDSSAIYTPPSV